MFDLDNGTKFIKATAEQLPECRDTDPDGLLKNFDTMLMNMELVIYEVRQRIWDINYARIQERIKQVRPQPPKSRPITTVDDLMS